MKFFKRNAITTSLLLAMPIIAANANAADDETPAKAEKDVEVIEVQGIRGSLKRAEAIKFTSKNIVEAISAEDIGKFSDDSLAESLQRLPGVQVEEDTVGSAGDKVSIRGLGSQFVVATVNGRTAWGSGTGEGRDLRSFNFNVIPSEIASEVIVTKTPVANTVESGIGGAVDVKTLRPLDAKYEDKNWIAAAEVRADMMNIGDKDLGNRLNGAFIAKNDDETLGGYVAFNMSETHGGRDRQEVRYKTSRDFYIDHNNNFVADDDELYEDLTTIRDVNPSSDRYSLERGALAAALQFQPNDSFNIVADVLYTKADSINQRPNTRFDYDRILNKNDVLFAPNAIELAEGGLGSDLAQHTTFMDFNGARCLEDGVETTGMACTPKSSGRLLSMRDQYRNNFRDAFIGGLNVEYFADNLKVTGDIFFNKLDTQVHEVSIDAETYDIEHGPISVDMRNDDGIVIGHNADDLVHDNFDARRLRIRQRTNEGEQMGARLDFEYDLDNEYVTSVQFGTRYNKSEFAYTVSQRLSWGEKELGDSDDLADGFNQAMYGSGNGLFLEPIFGVTMPMFDIESAGRYITTHQAPFANAGGYGPCQAGDVSEYLSITGPLDTLITDECRELNNSFEVEETTFNLYASADLEWEVMDIPVYANVGVRYVNTENTSWGVIEDENEGLPDDPALIPALMTETEGDFAELLPNLNVQLDLADSLQLRLAASKSLSRPDLYDLTPRTKVSTSGGDDDLDIESCQASDDGCTIKKGNPDLNPYMAWNYDLTVMWEMPTEGFLALSIYKKDIEGFIFESISEPAQDADGKWYSVTQPTNANDASVDGYEIGVHQPFSFLPEPFNGFGVQLNYSYTESELVTGEDDDSNLGFNDSYGLPGASKHNGNAVLYFESDNFSARLAYVYRDSYFSSFNGGSEGEPRFFAEQEALSASLGYDITDNLQIKLQGSHLTEDGRTEFTNYESATTRYTSRPSTYSLSLRGKF